MSNDTIHDLVAPYALDALDHAERAEFEAHLAGCAPCQTELAELTAGAELLAEAEAIEVPELMRRRVLAAVDETPQVNAESPSRLGRWLTLAVAAAVVAAVAIGAFITNSGLDANDIITAQDAARYELAATDALPSSGSTVEFFYSNARGAGVIRAAGLPDVADDLTYQAWLVGDGDPIPSGLFRPDDGNATLIIDDGFDGAQLIAITVEPAGGSPAPTTDVILVASIDA